MTSTESHQFSNIAATTGAFTLMGGEYDLAISATWNAGSAQLETLSDDAVTWINVGSAITANGYSTYDLAPGQYRIAITSATAVYAALATVPKSS
jgi:hypothetical protein